MTEQRESWHFDKRVPIALIVAIVVQTVGIVWWAATINSAVDLNARDIERQSATISSLQAARETLAITTARAEQESIA
jgi:hypothetical protein